MKKQVWQRFHGGNWERKIDVRNFIQTNYTLYEGGAEFLAPVIGRTNALMKKLDHPLEVERELGGVLDIDMRTAISLTSYKPGYLDREQEIIVGLQTDRPLRRGANPFDGLNMARKAYEAYEYQLSPEVEKEFQYRTTHNEGVLRVYTDEIRATQHCGITTGLPDAYGRGRIVGDYRRVALYGVDRLIEEKKKDKAKIGEGVIDADHIR